MRLFNSLSRSKETLQSLHPGAVSLYTCGPTVYDFAHIGNLRTFIFEDILKRSLQAEGYTVQHVMNITDVGHLTDDADAGEDKMEKGAKREHKSVWDIAREYTEAFLHDLDALNVRVAEQLPRATDYIDEQIAFIEELEAKGHAYVISDGVYFDTRTFPSYGKMARLDMKGQEEGARVEKNTEKRNSTDFALWKFSPKETVRAMSWPSPWGVGFPGWHIECSAMARALLGDQIDIHCGGIDHMPVHHTNEIAQTESATGKPFAQFWMHGEFLLVNEGRMGKSVGNFITLKDLTNKGFDPLAYRYFLLTAHYRSKLNFTWEELKKHQTAYNGILYRLSQMPVGKAEPDADVLSTFSGLISDDLALPQAIALLWEVLNGALPQDVKAATIFAMDDVLGLSMRERSEELYKKLHDAGSDFKTLLAEREAARRNKDFARADAIRNEIQHKGFDIEDDASGTILKPRS